MTTRLASELPEVAQTVTATTSRDRNDSRDRDRPRLADNVVPHVIVLGEAEVHATSGQPKKVPKQKHQNGRPVNDQTGMIDRVATPVKNHRDEEEDEGAPGNERQRVMPIAAKPAHVLNRVIVLIQTNVLIPAKAPNLAKALSPTTRDLEDADPVMTRATENVPNEIARSESDRRNDSDLSDSDPSREAPMQEGHAMSMTMTISMKSTNWTPTWSPIALAKIKKVTTTHPARGRDEEAAEDVDVDATTKTIRNETMCPSNRLTIR